MWGKKKETNKLSEKQIIIINEKVEHQPLCNSQVESNGLVAMDTWHMERPCMQIYISESN